MLRGDRINVTEHRAVLHVALRAPRGQSIVVDGEDVVPQVHAVLDRMADFATRVRDGNEGRRHVISSPAWRQSGRQARDCAVFSGLTPTRHPRRGT
jgi:glucose-6-phosphate isomerase